MRYQHVSKAFEVLQVQYHSDAQLSFTAPSYHGDSRSGLALSSDRRILQQETNGKKSVRQELARPC